ncbi:MAG: RHS repeat-associated core domain-containing protein [Arenicella sp.]
MRLTNMKIFALALSMLTSLFAGTVLAERTTTYFHSDGLGSIVAASDENGDLIWRKQYQPFGAQIQGSDTSEETSFTGKQFDKDTGLTYFGARYYDPMIGRFTSTDPVGPLASESNPFFFNRYAYAYNNPYRYVDPDGRMGILARIFSQGAAAGAGAGVTQQNSGFMGDWLSGSSGACNCIIYKSSEEESGEDDLFIGESGFATGGSPGGGDEDPDDESKKSSKRKGGGKNAKHANQKKREVAAKRYNEEKEKYETLKSQQVRGKGHKKEVAKAKRSMNKAKAEMDFTGEHHSAKTKKQ